MTHAYTGPCEAFRHMGGAPTRHQVIAGLNFIVNGPGISGVSAAVLEVDHEHIGVVRRDVALTTANIICEHLTTYYEESLATPAHRDVPDQPARVFLHQDLICELFSIFLVCRIHSSWSVLDMTGSTGALLTGIRSGARADCAWSWANGILTDTDILNNTPARFMKMCIGGAVACLAHCRGADSPFWSQCEGFFDNRWGLGALPPKSRSRTAFGEMLGSAVPVGKLRVVFREVYVDATSGPTLERRGGVATLYAHIPASTPLPDLLTWTRANYEDVAILLGGSPCEAMFKIAPAGQDSPGIHNTVLLSDMENIALSALNGVANIVVHFRIRIPEEDKWFRLLM
jgi:hypothetical protein